MKDDEKQPSIAGEPEVVSDGSGDFTEVMAFGLIVFIITGGLCALAATVIHVLEVYGYR